MLYYYAHSGHKVGLERVRRGVAIIKKLKEEGITILLVEQNVHLALSIADYGYILENGKIVDEGEAKKLEEDPRVIEAYLGLG